MAIADPPSLGRKPHRKTRLGCRTCRTRRVKCGEQRPVCSACERLGLDCAYYNSPHATNPAVVCQAAKGSMAPTAAFRKRPQQVSYGPFDDQTEWQYFQMFTDEHMKWFRRAPCGDAELCVAPWMKIYLPLMHAQELFKHLVLAVSAAQMFGNPDGTPSHCYFGAAAQNEAFFLHHYGQALHLTLEAQAKRDITTVICAATCFCVIESCRHQPVRLVSHLNSAVKLLDEFEHDQQFDNTIGRTQIDEIIRPTVHQLDSNKHWLLETLSRIQIR